MTPPVLKLMRFGHAFEKSYDGLTTLAATFVVSVAIVERERGRAPAAAGCPSCRRVVTDPRWDRLEDEGGRRRGEHADQREEGHGGRQAERLAVGLVTLAPRRTG